MSIYYINEDIVVIHNILKGVFTMELIDIRVPRDYAKKVLTSELNSYAYNYENQVLVYLREFS